MSDFLLELRCEEIPARMQAGARADLERLFRAEMAAAGLAVENIRVWSTPRRLALVVYDDLPETTEAVSEEAKGPPEGAPDAAIDGFCRKNGVTRDQLTLRDVKGRNTYFAVIEKPGRAVKDVLAESIPAIIRAFPWPKSMRWGAASISTESLRWVRPLSGIVALFNGEVVACEIDGIRSGRETLGHRFHHTGPIAIESAHTYASQLLDARVIVEHTKREALIRQGAAEAASAAGLTLVADEGLVIENAGLTEYPVPLLGRFDEAFLDVSPEVIQLTARVNQKYFVCEGADGKLANAFVCTANIEAADGGAAIVDGNRKVLAARLSDARFFWELDQKTMLEEHAKKLERITFHEKLGTVADKVDRVAKLARWLVESDIVVPAKAGTAVGSDKQPIPASAGMTKEELADLAEQAARLAKADLVTEMVGEFPELQGVMGGYYARAEGLPDAVADAIRDHYKPVGQGDEVPTAPVTVAVSLADKLDTLSAFYFAGEKPTGSKDPFALRRAALGVIRLTSENALRLPLQALLEAAIGPLSISAARAAFSGQPLLDILSKGFPSAMALGRAKDDGTHDISIDGVNLEGVPSKFVQPLVDWIERSSNNASWREELLDFFADRLKVQQREAGVRHDLIDAVFALGGEDDLVRLLARVHALQAFMETEDGANLLAGYKRAANILKKEGWENATDRIARTGDEDPMENVDDPQMRAIYAARAENALSYTPEPAEKALIDALDAAEPKAAAAIEAEDFAAAMAALASLRAPIDRFFDEVTVNADEENKRQSRLALLARFRAAVHNVADFSRIEG
ncbi:glycine--tRNA ligase subunit beta [Tsuneonella mangrovi]|uniref:glycine--tRNA ligase subunit beta n=1 Tax=Tsuneonella mangrovi TaxID=1982042 RepID=UPI000BA1E24D|nr:glycine--tRNA ligase subunit beta [Tsuneonella mangrovi]